MAFPTPRSWEFVSRLQHLSEDIASEVVAGAGGGVGLAPSTWHMSGYTTACPIWMPSVEGGRRIPSEQDLKYAVITGLASRAQAEHIDHLVDYLCDYPPEFSVLGITLLNHNFKKEVTRAPSFIKKWVPKFKSVVT